MNRVLWVIQWLLAVLFLFAGGSKLILPVEEMTRQVPLPGAFLRFIGVAEILGAAGLILPANSTRSDATGSRRSGGHLVIVISATAVTLRGR